MNTNVLYFTWQTLKTRYHYKKGKEKMKKCLVMSVAALILLALMTGCCLSHTWQEATCTAPKTCASCGAKEGEPLVHAWIAATCTNPKTCNTCHITEGEAKGHSIVQWVTKTEATCQAAGLAQGKCSICDAVMEKEIEILEHVAGEWKITENASITNDGKREKACTMCGELLETESFTLSEEEYETAYKAACKTYSFSQIARSPAEYKGKLAVFTGEVIQVQQDKAYGLVAYVLRVNVTKQGSYYTYYTDTIYVEYITSEDAPRILEDDIITMYGTLEGEKTYTTVMGASVTIPLFSAEYVDIN